MSHFSVMVIGGNVEEQLAPYHEFECTGINDEFVQEIDVTKECRESGLDWRGLEDKTVTSVSDIDTDGPHKYGFAIVDAEGNIVKAVRRTNPNAKWDWYQIGGRWSGFLKLKNGRSGLHGERSWTNRDAPQLSNYCDIAKKEDIDIEGMRDEAGKEAAGRWDKAHQAAGGATWEPWSVIGPRTNYDDAARETYASQEAVKVIRAAFDDPFHRIDQYLVSREQFIQQARDAALSTYALVKDGKWFAKGEMGWFGMSNDEITQDEWNKEMNALLDSLSDDTTIAIVDCHI